MDSRAQGVGQETVGKAGYALTYPPLLWVYWMEMPEIWQEVCLAFASWLEVVELSIYGLGLKK